MTAPASRDSAARPTTRRAHVLLNDLQAIIPSGLWTAFRAEQIGGSIAAVEIEARADERRRVVEAIIAAAYKDRCEPPCLSFVNGHVGIEQAVAALSGPADPTEDTDGE